MVKKFHFLCNFVDAENDQNQMNFSQTSKTDEKDQKLTLTKIEAVKNSSKRTRFVKLSQNKDIVKRVKNCDLEAFRGYFPDKNGSKTQSPFEIWKKYVVCFIEISIFFSIILFLQKFLII